MRKVIAAGLTLLMMVFGLVMTAGAASADDNNYVDKPADFAEAGWFNRQCTDLNGAIDAWLCDQFPLECRDDSAPHIKFIWIYPDNVASKWDAKKAEVHGYIRTAAAIFMASSEKVLKSDLSYPVRSMVPWIKTNADCTPHVSQVALPASTWVGDDGAIFDQVQTALRAKGYNHPDRLYYAFSQKDVGGTTAGITWGTSDDRPYSDNAANTGNRYGLSFYNGWYGDVVAHEIGHMLGAVQHDAPDHNPANWGHSGRQKEIMAYNYGGIGEWVGTNPSHSTAKFLARFDPARRSYFSPSAAEATTTWLQTHWNMNTSRFLAGHYIAPLPPQGAMIAGGTSEGKLIIEPARPR